MELRQRACEALSIADPVAKAAAARALYVDCQRARPWTSSA
jgi:hypothetical protein